jgi:superfamily II DNA or RNA helicase
LTLFTPEEIEKFHPKYGILYDSADNIVAFTGSINETESAWKRNIENLDFYASWEPGELVRRIQHRINQFENIWSGQISDAWTVLELPDAVKDKIIRDYAPQDFPMELVVPEEAPRALRSYQQAAVDAWKQKDSNGMLVMATGTGKTRTAKACIEISKNEGTLLTVVVVPYQHIGDQWLKELDEFHPSLVGGNRASELAKIKTDLVLGRIKQATLVVVKETAGKPDFVEAVRGLAAEVDNALLVADEVHWLGATAYQPILDPVFNFRLGLSATPKRHFDEDGTDYLMQYFSGVAFDFPISEALKVRDERGNPILCPYEYHPEFVNLSEHEKKEYKEFSKKIARTKSLEQTYDVRSYLESLYLARARIIKSASSKIPYLRKILTDLGPDLKHCLIYCADKEQLKAAADILNDLRITAQQITGEESTNASSRWNGLNEREFIIENFARGKSSVLLAIRCLDEGVDIPAAEVGIILASSGNSKEFIQRRGRLMRPYPGKEKAVIYDLCVMPDPSQGDDFPTLRENEMNRIREFAEDALNSEAIAALIDSTSRESKN